LLNLGMIGTLIIHIMSLRFIDWGIEELRD
jgi:hypothetical protein